MEKEVLILGESFDRELFPKLAEMMDRSPAETEAQVQSVADAWHEGSIVPAVMALESDLAHG